MRIRVPVTAAVLGVIALAVTLYLLAWWEHGISTRETEIILDARRLLALSKSFHAQIARQAALRDSALADAARARADAQALDVVIVRQLGDTTIVGLRLRFPPLDSLLASYERRDLLRLRELLARETARQADARALRLSLPRVTQLEGSLADVVEVTDCHMLGVSFFPRCPSRTLSFGIGAAAGIIAVLVVK